MLLRNVTQSMAWRAIVLSARRSARPIHFQRLLLMMMLIGHARPASSQFSYITLLLILDAVYRFELRLVYGNSSTVQSWYTPFCL